MTDKKDDDKEELVDEVSPKGDKPDKKEDKPRKTGIESRHNNKVIINFDTKTINADLGRAYGSVHFTFDEHAAIQYKYVYTGEAKTQAEIALEFDFLSMQAAAKYLEMFEIRKSSPIYTDIALETGMTEEEAVRYSLNAIKLRIRRKVALERARAVQRAADKHFYFKENVITPLETAFATKIIPREIPPVRIDTTPKNLFGVHSRIIAITDPHHLRLGMNYDNTKEIWTPRQSVRAVKRVNKTYISHIGQTGVPEKIFLILCK